MYMDFKKILMAIPSFYSLKSGALFLSSFVKNTYGEIVDVFLI